MTRQISFDLESLSLEPNAMILAIGAVEFDAATGELGNTFYRTIDITAKGGGGVMDPATVKWWVNQSRAARERIFADPEAVPLAQALIDFSEWLGFDDSLPEGEYPDVKLWQRGDRDSLWLTSAYEGLNLARPYRYNQVADQRSITDLFPSEWFVWDGTAHDALSDAILQAEHLAKALRVIQPAIASIVEQTFRVRESLKPEHRRSVPAHDRVNETSAWHKAAATGESLTDMDAEGLEKVRQDTLMMGYTCGLTRVDEAVDNIRRRAMQLYPYAEIPQRDKDLDDAFTDFTYEELILDHLTPENKAKVDRELEELSAKPLADEGDPLAFEEVPPCVNLVDTAKDALSMENQRIVPCSLPRADCCICGAPDHGMPCPTTAPKS